MGATTTNLLRELGFNQLEAEVYLALLPREPMTAYRLGTLVGKPTANVYKAVESLARRGAVMVQEGESRAVAAVPVADFLGQTERDFVERTRDLSDRLANLQRQYDDERVYRLESPAQVLERARQMLDAGATTIAVVDAFPAALAAVAPAIRRAIDRGVELCVQAYAPIDLPGADLVVTSFGADSIAAWGGEQLNVVIDGREHLLALLSADLDVVVQAVWSQSAYLSSILHAGRLCEQTIHKLLAVHEREKLGPRARKVLDAHRFFVRSTVPGHQDLRSHSSRRSST